MNKILGLVLALNGLLGISEGQIIQSGQCDEDFLQSNFDISRFNGTWYEISRAPSDLQTADCSRLEFTNTNTAGFLGAANVAVNRNFREEATGSLFYGSDARLTLRLDSMPNDVDFWAVMTDYDNFALMYNCQNIGTTNRSINLWKLGRTTTYTQLVEALINTAILRNFGIDAATELNDVDHSDDACYELPVITPGEPVILPGQCDENITVIQNFNGSAFLGRWHTIASYASDNNQGSCGTAVYSLNDDGTIGVVNSEVASETLRQISGFAELSADGSSVLTVNLEVAPGVFNVQTLKVLATDYDNYAISYVCNDIDTTQKRVYSWILSRTRTLSEASSVAVNNFVDTILDLNDQYYIPMNQTDVGCFYYPESSGNQPVVFPGSCDLNIPAMSNFDTVAYMGLWHEIESYPSTFQQGTCNNANYSINAAGTVDVYNTLVSGQTLSSISGIAVPVATDGSGKLDVTFPIFGTSLTVTTNYWVLTTDYTSYALVYTCEDLPDDQRTVWSWKLSRTKSLTTAANTAMNSVINSINVLDSRYYQTRDQSAEGCFFFPEPVLGKPVVFPGQCDESIAAVPSFNFTLFPGTWHEVAAYPKVEQPGECVNHEYSVSTGTSFSLVSNQIFDQFLYSNNASVQITSTDGSAKFIITFENNGNEIIIPYWILATDYSTYALAYSCVNIDDDWRGIWSWKLSRTKQLTQEATTAINTTMANIDVLAEHYFELTDQTDEACFYLPELLPGEPVVLVGQCESDIPTVPNFDATRYQGRWRLIESYPSEFQTGGCIDATYNIQDDGTVLVVNSQVVNEQLDTMIGVAEPFSDGTARLRVTFPVAGTNMTVSLDYWVVDTDYDSYALVYSCSNVNTETRRIFSWKMSRTRELTANASIAINTVINSINVLNNRYYEVINQTDVACFYYPEPVENQPVVFRGTCDLDIPAMPNFDAVAYMGLWHEIESYPSQFQQGTCNNAYYSINSAGTVDVYNTLVSGQTLSSISGIAVPVATDGSGKLDVTFPIFGTNLTVTTNYWVLDTDYTSYALVYTCAPTQNEDERAVWSWKLSRTKQLTSQANTAISNVINTVQVLDQRYFQVRDQSEEGCFYYPEVTGEPVMFPGRCDQNISAVSNFNLTAFSGIWHEISSYPKAEGQDGQCLNYDFSAISNSVFNLITNQVIGLYLDTNEAAVVQVATDGSGKFEITVDNNGTAMVIPYWILDTDYDNYALAYSCLNYENDIRGVWSWKLSRSKELTPAALTTINQTMSTVDVLRDIYFEDIDQSDDACFYLPELSLNEAVIFVGQCDENMPVVTNFNVERYGGRWFDTQSYYHAPQDGTCQIAEYTLTPEGVVTVYNTKVVNESLSTISGTARIDPTAASGEGKLLVTFPIDGSDLALESQYWILDTDYDNYSLVYSCTNLPENRRRVYSWKLSRTRELSAPSVSAIQAVVNQVPVLDDRYYITRNHTESACFYFPEPEPNRPVVFRGQCDESVQAFQNFDPVAYMGLWYDVGSYPQEFQFGSCPTATYTLNPDLTVDVYNTQVVGQQLDDISGVARVVSEDGSAQLEVTFPIPGLIFNVSSPYWVLSTDYDSYALVYTCVNVNEETYRVSSWKLSRTTNLTAAAEQNITSVMNNIKVLDDRYYENRGHSDEDCFAYPQNFGGNVILEGSCQDQNVVQNFDLDLFTGKWYEVSRFPSQLQSGECVTHEFSINQIFLNLEMTIVNNERLNTGTGIMSPSADGNGTFSAIFTRPNSASEQLTIHVLDTDYTNYALLFGCRDNPSQNEKQIFSWKLSRSESGLSNEGIENINTIVSENVDLFEPYYEETDQTLAGCFHYPVFDDSVNTIDLPGPCNETVQAVSNFNITAYSGRWFEVARYPQRFQEGQCTRATYSPAEDGGLQVLNQIVNSQTLNSISGSAVPADDSGRGILNVTLIVGGAPRLSNFYVLATDYDNYALVYHCRNLDNGDRRVSSWKLSRERTLNPEFNAIFDPIIETTQGLLEDYYNPTSQTDDDCFYIPEVNPNEAVIFRGQCAEVSGMQAFDAARYVGWWHEIKRYPTGSNIGECISTQILGSGNYLVAVDTSVTGLTADVTESALQISNDGRLTRIINGQTSSVVWVLDTDYDNYALLYSCENEDDGEHRRVWSAIHSKTRELTSEDQMASIIDSNPVLYEQFYIDVDQTDEACFHYPEQSFRLTILPGQCDENIPVVQDFDAARYSGTWYEIERYLQPLTFGTCVGTRYTLNNDGVFDFVNWQQEAEELLKINGNATLASIDGSGKLLVTWEYPETNDIAAIELWILATDYVTYSLAYSCINMNEYERVVMVWKLSRERTMAPSGNTAINTIINQREELYADYFESVEQNEDCHDPSSSMHFKSSLVFVLICAVVSVVM